MQMTRLWLSLTFGTLCLSATHALAQTTNNFSVGGTVGTQGVGVEVKAALTPNMGVRGTLTTLPISRSEVIDGVDYEAEVDFTNAAAFLDIYPFANSFHISGGFYGGEKSAELIGTPAALTQVEIGGQTFTGAEIGRLEGDVSYNDFAPFIGFGFDNYIRTERLWSFNARAGVMFLGDPDVTLSTVEGALSNDPRLQAEIDNERDNLEEELEDFKLYPVLSVGVSRRF